MELTKAHNRAWARFITKQPTLVNAIETALKESNLPDMKYYDILWALENMPNHQSRLYELADELHFARHNVTRLLERMEKDGFVIKTTCEEDGRGLFAKLTDEGLQMRKKMWQVKVPAIKNIFADKLSIEEANTLINIMEKL